MKVEITAKSIISESGTAYKDREKAILSFHSSGYENRLGVFSDVL
jgi:hypothetical protein